MPVAQCVSFRRFVDLLSFTKFKEIRTLTKTNADIDAFYEYAIGDTIVDLTNPVTSNGLSALIALGVITEQDKDNVLNNIPLNY